MGINRSYLAVFVVLAILVIGLAYYRPVVSAEVSGVPVSLQSWWFRRPITINVYAEMQNPERVIGVFPRVRLNIPYYGYMNPDFRDVRFEYGYVLPSYWVSIDAGRSAVVDVELPIAGKGRYTVYMYYGNPVAERYNVDYPDIGFVWARCLWSYVYKVYGVMINYACGDAVTVVWVRSDGPTVLRFYVTGYVGYMGYYFVALLRGKWGMEYINSTAADFYRYIYRLYGLGNATMVTPFTIDFAVPSAGWYTFVVKGWFNDWYYGVPVVYLIEDLGTGNKFGNAVLAIQIDGHRARLVPVLWDSYYYSVTIGDAQPVAYVAPMTPTPIWNATIGNAYFEYYVAPRTVTVSVPVTVTVATPIYVTVPPGTITTTIYVPVTTITSWVALPPTTIYRTVTVTVPEFTSRVYTTTVYVPTTITIPVTRTITTTVPVATTTTVGGTPTVTTIWVTTTTTTTTYYYTTTVVTSPWMATIITPYTTVTRTITTSVPVTTTIVGGTPTVTTVWVATTTTTTTCYYTTTAITSPWIATIISPYTTVTRTITTSVPVTTTIYAAVTLPVYYTLTTTLVNTGTDTVTTTVYVNGTVTGVSGSYAAVYPVVVGPYGGVTTTTAYWIVKESYTTTVTEYGGFAASGYGWIVLLVFIAIIGFAIFYLVRKR